MLGKRILQVPWLSLLAASCLLVFVAATPRDLSTTNSPVADAAKDSDVATVRTLLRGGEDVNASQGDGMTALHWASMQGDEKLTEMLLYAGANVHAKTRLGAYTPLLMAAKIGHGPVVKRLLDAGADPNSANAGGTTALMYAAASGSADAVRNLLDHEAGVDATEGVRGRTPLMYAAAFNRHEVIGLLLESGADPTMVTTVRDVADLEKKDFAVFRKSGGPFGQAQPAEGTEAKKEDGKKKAAAEAPVSAERSNRVRSTGTASASQSGVSEEKVKQEPTRAPGAGNDSSEEAKKGKNIFAKLFGWLPGVGAEKEGETRRRRRRVPYGQLVGKHGGLAPIHFAARQGHLESVKTLLESGAHVDSVTTGDHTSALLIATVNGHFDLANYLLEQGADPNITSEAGAAPLYAAINLQWAPKALYPQPQAYRQQDLTYLEFMERLLESGAEPNTRLHKKVWYSGYNFDLSGVNEMGATAFWRAAYGNDVEAMKLLVSYGADPNVPTMAPSGDPTDGIGPRERKDVSGRKPVPVGGPAVAPLSAACGVGYGRGFAANSHRYAPSGFMPAIQFLVEELGADVNTIDHEGYAPLHHCAARGDNECIEFLVSKGADVTVVSREGQTTADMANGPVQRVQPFPETVALLMKLGSKNSDKCVSC